MGDKLKASDYIIDFLVKKNIKAVFGYQGGMITHLVNSIYEHSEINFIQTYHEQSAAFAAVGYARYSNNLGVAIATSGPGATNMITGIADAFFDSIPTLFITGQVNTNEYKYNKPIRQLGFQEANIVEMLKPITKYIKLVDNLEELPEALAMCIQIATSGRKGPVLLDIPMNIQRGILTNIPYNLNYSISTKSTISDNQLNEIVDLLSKAQRPLILIGGGVYNAGVINEVRDFIHQSKIPFVSSLLGKNGCDEYDELYIGTIGSYGNRCANMAIANTDLLLVLGARLDVRQTGADIKSFVIKGNIIHVDIDKNELDCCRVIDTIKVHSDLKTFIHLLLQHKIKSTPDVIWYDFLNILRQKYSQQAEISRNIVNSAPYKLIEKLNLLSSSDAIFCADVGQNQMWAMQMLQLKPEQRFFTSGGLGSMGSALPIAVGVAFAKNNDSTVFSINGDGGAHMALQSLMLISQYNLPVKVIIINNHALGMITQFQELYFNNITTGTTYSGGYQVPDFSTIAKAYQLKYFKIDAQNNRVIDDEEYLEFINCRNCILEYVIDANSRVFPKLEFSHPIYNPSPVISSEELAANMLVSLEK